jgi:hypothetical protein
MYRPVTLFLALTFLPAIALAQQPCTTDGRRVVNEIYRHMLEREADAGSAHWVDQLQNRGMTVRALVRQIATSDEHTQRFWRQESGEATPYFRAAETLFRHILGRQPDAAGARSWASQGVRSGVNAIVDQIVGSTEYTNQFGDWGVPGSSGLAYCAPGTRPVNQPQVPVDQSRYREMDRNGDGIVSRTEWRGNAQAFENQDWNNDDVLSGDELDGGAARFGQGRGRGRGRGADNQEARRAERFDSLDRNRNGRIDPREFDGTVAAFNRLDVNNDNILSRAEMVNADVAAAPPAVATSGQLTRERFDSLDVNANGRIELREWNGSAAAFDRLDVNNDNILSRAEMANADVAAAPATAAQVRFDRMDVNTNGRIELREWDGSATAFDRLDVNNDNVLTRAEMGQ